MSVVSFANRESGGLVRGKLNAGLVLDKFGAPNFAQYIAGQYYDNANYAAASATLAGAVNRIELSPFAVNRDVAIDRIGFNVTTGVASAQGRALIYAAGADGWAATKVYESGNLNFATSSTFVEDTLSFTFLAGVLYWLGVHNSSTATIRAVPLTSAVSCGLLTTTGTGYITTLRRTVAFGSAPDNFNFVNGDRAIGITPPSVRFRAA